MSIHHPTSEIERDPVADRDNFRRIVQREADALIKTVFETSPADRLDECLIINRMLDGLWNPMTEFRRRNLNRFTQRLEENSGKLS